MRAKILNAPIEDSRPDPTRAAHLRGVSRALAAELDRRALTCLPCLSRDGEDRLGAVADLFPEQRELIATLLEKTRTLQRLRDFFRITFRPGSAVFAEGSPVFWPLKTWLAEKPMQLTRAVPKLSVEKATSLVRLLATVRELVEPQYFETFCAADFLPDPGLVVSNIGFASFAAGEPHAAQEFVTLRNTTLRPLPLRGWSLRMAVSATDESRLHYRFDDDVVLGPGESVRIYSGAGKSAPGLHFAGHERPQFDTLPLRISLQSPHGRTAVQVVGAPGDRFARYSREDGRWVRRVFPLTKKTFPAELGRILHAPWSELPWSGKVANPGRPQLSDPLPLADDLVARLFPGLHDGLVLWGPPHVGRLGLPGEKPEFGFPWLPGPPVEPLPPLKPGPFLPPEEEEDDDGGHEEDDGDGGVPTGGITELIRCEAWIDGPHCSCIGIPVQFSAGSNCPAQCFNWKVEPAAIATLVVVNGCTATIRPRREGIYYVSCWVSTPVGSMLVETHAHAYDVRHVLGGTPDTIVPSAPLVQPHPFVAIAKPAETAEGDFLPAGSYKVHQEKLEQGFARYRSRQIEFQELTEKYLEIEVALEGSLADFFEEIDRLSWKVNEGPEVFLVKGEEFTDTTFATKMPGEKQMNPRVVLLKGLGESTVKLTAENPIQRRGTDWMNFLVGLRPAIAREIADLKQHLAYLLSLPPDGSGALATRIQQTTLAIENKLLEGLRDPGIEAWHNVQVPPAFALTAAAQSRTQGWDDDGYAGDRSGTVMATSPIGNDAHSLLLREEIPRRFLNYDPHRAYWVTSYTYSGSKKTWTEHGMLRGVKEGQLASSFQCCTNAVPVYGVEPKVPGCVTLKKNEKIRLDAEGRPAMVQGALGEYRWSVVAKPDADAQPVLSSDTWSTSPQVDLSVDTAGIYTVKVEYRLGRPENPLTYALADIAVDYKAAARVKWSVHRTGPYVGELAAHVSRPYYQERSPVEARAAEMLIRPEVATETLGKRFCGSFVTHPELAFSDELGVRVYFKDYAPGLSPADYRDYLGPPWITVNAQAPYEAIVDLACRKTIKAIHLINVKYRHVMRLKGQAAAINFAYRRPKALPCPAGPGTPPPPSSSGVFIATEPDITVTPDRQRDLPPLVNLLLYQRDLGAASASNGFQSLSNAGDAHNIPNGNVHLQIPLCLLSGHGVSTQLSLCYNSIQGSFQDSLEFFQDLNGVSTADLHAYYCPNPCGKGWTHSYNLHVREYVRPWELHPEEIDELIELTAPDGNRIQFLKDRSSAQSPFEYRPLHASDHWWGDPEIGHSLQLRKHVTPQPKRIWYVLENIRGDRWRFDDKGRLTEISTRVTRGSGGAIRPLQVEHVGNDVKVTDSSRRVTTLRGLIPGRGQNALLELDDPLNKNWVFVAAGQVERVTRGALQAWGFAYHADLGQKGIAAPAPCSLLKTLTDPKNVASDYVYYDGGPFRGFDKPELRDFWGRLGQAAKATGEHRREQVWFYQPLDRARQSLVYRNAGNVEFAIAFRWVELAVASRAYVVQEKDAALVLKGTPNHDQVLRAERTGLPTKTVEEFRYHRETKLVSERRDLHRLLTKLDYEWHGPDAFHGAFLLKKITRPDGAIVEQTYTEKFELERLYTPRLPAQKLEDTPFTEMRYNARGQMTHRFHPNVGTAAQPEIATETWRYAPTGQMLSHTNVDGVRFAFGYNEGGRDPQRTGSPTSRSVTLRRGRAQPQPLTWEFTYDLAGRVKEVFDPVFGGVTKREYHELGPVREIQHPAIPTASGAGTCLETFFYDPLLQPTHRFVGGGGGTQEWKRNDHGEVTEERDLAGHRTERKYHKSGAPAATKLAGGNETTFVVDELDRPVRIHYPAPDPAGHARPSELFTDIIAYHDEPGYDALSAVVERQRFLIRAVGEVPPYSQLRHLHRSSHRGGLLVKEATMLAPGGATLETVYEHDVWGEASKISFYDGTSLKRTVTIERDARGRVVAEVETGTENGGAGSTRRSAQTLDAAGRVAAQFPPAFDGLTPKIAYEHDELGRVFTIKNSGNRIVRRIDYADFGNNGAASALASRAAAQQEWAQNPARDDAQSELIVVAETRFNRRGLPIERFAGAAGATTPKKQIGYTAAGHVEQEIDETGVVRKFIRDPLDRVLTVTTSRTFKRANIGWRQFNIDNPAHTETREEIVHYRYAPNGEIAEVRDATGTEARTYDTANRLKRHARSDGVVEEFVYDAAGRVTRRHAGALEQSLVYDNAARAVTTTFRRGGAVTEIRAVHDWEQKLREFRTLRNEAGGAAYNKCFVRYAYGDFGRLARKDYLAQSTEAVLGSLAFTYNAADLRTATEVVVQRPGIGAFRQKDVHTYNADFQLTESTLENSSSERFLFGYNAAGLLTKLGRPLLGGGGLLPRFTNATSFRHDRQGRLTGLIERKGNEPADQRLSAMDFFYAPRVPESWEPAAAWAIDREDALLPSAPALRGLNYRRHFAEAFHSVPETDEIAQDFGYDRDGRVKASITRFRDSDAIRVDARVAEWDALYTERVSARNYREYRDGQQDLNLDYTVTSRSVFGAPSAVVERRGERATGAPKTDPKNFYEATTYAGGQPSELVQGEEDLRVPGSAIYTRDEQYRRTFAHDALGRLLSVTQRAEKISPSLTLEPALSLKESLPQVSWHQYGPDGEELFRTVAYHGPPSAPDGEPVPQTADTLTISDGPHRVAEFDYGTSRLVCYRNVPGLGSRLSVRVQQPSDPLGGGTAYYRFDHKGATLYLTNAMGEVLVDFRCATPDGEQDLFGIAIGPRWHGGAVGTLRQRTLFWPHYQPGGPRIDTGMAALSSLDQRAERIGVLGHAAATVPAARNNYSFATGQAYFFTGTMPNTSGAIPASEPPEVWYVQVSKGAHGAIDALSFGLTRYVREKIVGPYGEPMGGGAYMIGFIGGVVGSVLLGYGATRAVGWTARLLGAYAIAGDVVSVATSTYHWATGTAKWHDALGFLPTLGWAAGGLRRARAGFRFPDDDPLIDSNILMWLHRALYIDPAANRAPHPWALDFLQRYQGRISVIEHTRDEFVRGGEALERLGWNSARLEREFGEMVAAYGIQVVPPHLTATWREAQAMWMTITADRGNFRDDVIDMMILCTARRNSVHLATGDAGLLLQAINLGTTDVRYFQLMEGASWGYAGMLNRLRQRGVADADTYIGQLNPFP